MDNYAREISHTCSVPKTIWMLWFQGLEQAPDAVKMCYLSWQQKNPGWKVEFLDETKVCDYVSLEQLEQPGLRKQALSDIIRINLLARYGGVWVDATCYCQTPLDEWLIPQLSSGFFAFERTDKPRYFDSWFLALEPGQLSDAPPLRNV